MVKTAMVNQIATMCIPKSKTKEHIGFPFEMYVGAFNILYIHYHSSLCRYDDDIKELNLLNIHTVFVGKIFCIL